MSHQERADEGAPGPGADSGTSDIEVEVEIDLDVEIVRVGLEAIDEFEPLWLQLRAHHAGLAPHMRQQPPSASWILRRDEYRAWLAMPDSFAVIARKAGRVVAYAVVVVHQGPDDTWVTGDRIAEVESLCVAAGERSGGLGSALLDFVDWELAAVGIRDVQIGVVAANERAISFYERRGLRPRLTIMSRFPAADATTATRETP